MFIFGSNNDKLLGDPDACYEAVASQEEAYLENAEEDLRMILEANDLPPGPAAERERAVEELITGDSDDPPLSDDSVAELLRPPL